METFNYNEQEEINNEEVEKILFEISSEDFLENEIGSQLNEGIFDSHKRNYLEFYLEKYKFIKSNYRLLPKYTESNGDDLEEEMKYNKNMFISDVFDEVCEKFDIVYTEDCPTTKLAKAVYTFFVIDYKENLKIFLLNVLKKNKQSLIKELKSRKRSRDIGASASKAKYLNINDAFIINNLEFILMDIIPSISFDGSFIDYIINSDDNVNYMYIRKSIDNDKIVLSEDTYRAFLAPFVQDREIGYTEIISDIVMTLVENAKQREINIFDANEA